MRVRFSFAFNVIGMIIPVAIALITIPVYIFLIGTARYGVLSIVWILLGYFGFLDFGLAQASTNALAKLTHASKQKRAGILVTALYLNLFLGAIGGVIIYFAGRALLHHLLTLSDAMNVEVENAFPWIACMLPLALLTGVARGAIESREHFFVVNVLDLIGYSLGQIVPILSVIIVGPSLATVIPAAFLARALSVVLNLGWIIRSEKLTTLRVFDRSLVRDLFGFGVWVSVTSVISPLLASIDQLLIGSVLGVTEVAHYAVPMNLATRSQIVATALARTLFPRFSRLGHNEAMHLAEKAIISLGYSFGALCGPVIVVAGPLMSLWIGADFSAHAAPVLELLLIGAWINAIAFIPYSFLQGQGRPDLVAKLHALEFLPFITILWLLLHRFGLPGAALAWNCRVAVDAALLIGVARFHLYNALRLVPAFLLMLTSYFVTQMAHMSVLWSWLCAALIFLAFAGCAIAFDATVRQMVLTLRVRNSSV
jgi:O-antigen/teichoic acid export membrane protein